MTWQELENYVEQLLIENNIIYKREGERVSRGHRASQGKYDFDIPGYSVDAIECKRIEALSDLTLPSSKYRTTRIKAHQLRALRETPNESGLLIYEEKSQRFFWVNMDELERLILANPKRRSMIGIDHLEIDIVHFIGSITITEV